MAIKEMKEQINADQSNGRSLAITPTPQHNIEKELQVQMSQLKAAYQQVLTCTC